RFADNLAKLERVGAGVNERADPRDSIKIHEDRKEGFKINVPKTPANEVFDPNGWAASGRTGATGYGFSIDGHPMLGFQPIEKRDGYRWDGTTGKPGDGPADGKPGTPKNAPAKTDGEGRYAKEKGYFNSHDSNKGKPPAISDAGADAAPDGGKQPAKPRYKK